MVIKVLVSDMQNKDIINQNTGVNLGKIIDLDINEQGQINYLVVGTLKMIKKFTNSEYKVKYENITKIGSDVILVDLK